MKVFYIVNALSEISDRQFTSAAVIPISHIFTLGESVT